MTGTVEGVPETEVRCTWSEKKQREPQPATAGKITQISQIRQTSNKKPHGNTEIAEHAEPAEGSSG